MKTIPPIKKDSGTKLQNLFLKKTNKNFDKTQIKSKWKKLKENYYDAKNKNQTSGESFTNFHYFEDLDKLFGDSPLCGHASVNIGTSRPDLPEIDEEDTYNEYTYDGDEESEQVVVTEAVAEQVVVAEVAETSRANERPRPDNDNTSRIRRKRENNCDKLLKFKYEDLEFKKKKFEYLKQLEIKKENERNRRHAEKRADFLSVYGIRSTDTEEYLIGDDYSD